ncbi:threonine/serine dehydratase [Plantactinospora siamensis]|uniref:Threonine/serine dehydratase n=1 Tax=Plantactinospora siamensis TaxID=555372 RepID=A0ABV6NSI3_9ACTN
MEAVTINHVMQARRSLAPRLPVTPMWSYPALNAETGASVQVKHENVQPVGAFKVRGGLHLLAGMTDAERARGVVTYSTGNHAQSLAYASAAFDAPCVLVMPAGANPAKVRAARALGAEVLLHGADLAGAQQEAERIAASRELRLVSPGETPELIAGVGTAYLEILEAVPDLDAMIVPVGSGTGAAAAVVVARALAPGCRVIAVQSSASPAAHDSWRAGRCLRRPDRTSAEGLATGRGFELPQRLMRSGLADFRLVSDEAIGAAQRLLASHAHTLAEGAGAAALAALLAMRAELAGQTVAIVCSGGNANPAELAALGAPATPA